MRLDVQLAVDRVFHYLGANQWDAPSSAQSWLAVTLNPVLDHLFLFELNENVFAASSAYLTSILECSIMPKHAATTLGNQNCRIRSHTWDFMYFSSLILSLIYIPIP